MKKVTGNKVAIAIFVLPTLLLYTVLVFYPIIQTAIKSLYEWDGINIGEFVGLKHYIKLFTRDKTFKVSLINGLLFPLVTVVYQIGLGSVIAFTLAYSPVKIPIANCPTLAFILPLFAAKNIVLNKSKIRTKKVIAFLFLNIKNLLI